VRERERGGGEKQGEKQQRVVKDRERGKLTFDRSDEYYLRG
jgi:hypothetical protein